LNCYQGREGKGKKKKKSEDRKRKKKKKGPDNINPTYTGSALLNMCVGTEVEKKKKKEGGGRKEGEMWGKKKAKEGKEKRDRRVLAFSTSR